MKNIFFVVIIAIIVFSCAKPNKTFQPQSPSVEISDYYQTRGYARDFTIDGNYLFVAVDQSGFSIYDLQNDSLVINYTDYLNSPRLIKTAHTTSESLLLVYDIYGSPASINCFDISNLNNPTYLPPIITDTGGLEDWRITSSSESDTLRLTFTKNDASSHKLKITDAIHENYTWQFSPILNADQLFDYNVHNFFKYDENTYYIANEQNGVAVIDVSNPESPVLTDYIETPGSAYDVKRVDNYLYVADRHEGFEVFKINEDESWDMIYHYDTSGLAKQLSIFQDYVAVASGGGGMYLFDISDRDNPKLLSNISESKIGYTYKVKFLNSILYAATRNGVYSFDIKK